MLPAKLSFLLHAPETDSGRGQDGFPGKGSLGAAARLGRASHHLALDPGTLDFQQCQHHSGTKNMESPKAHGHRNAHLLGGVLAGRSFLLASRGSPGLVGSGTGAVVLVACGGAGGRAGFFTDFSL